MSDETKKEEISAVDALKKEIEELKAEKTKAPSVEDLAKQISETMAAKEREKEKKALEEEVKASGLVDKADKIFESKEEADAFAARLEKGEVTRQEVDAYKKVLGYQEQAPAVSENTEQIRSKSSPVETTESARVSMANMITRSANPMFDPSHPDHAKANEEFAKALDKAKLKDH